VNGNCGYRLIHALLAGAAAIGVPAAALAQAVPVPAPPPAGAQLEEVVVTAQRREERNQDVPIAITAFTAERLSK